MNEELELGKVSLKNANDYADIKSNPVVESVLMPIVKAVPVIGDMIDSSMNKVIEEFQEKKENELIEVILKDKNSITSDMVNDVEFIVNFARTREAIRRLATNDKVKYFGSLTYNIGSEYAGKYGNLYYYDSTGRMIFQNAGAIDADGNISLNFSHASEYAVVIADYVITTENADNTATGGIATGDSTPIALYAVLCVMAIALAGIAAVTRKKNV